MKVLLADESVLMMDLLKQMLGMHKEFEIVAQSYNGNDTLEALRNLKPELAIVDNNLPGLSGLEVLEEIRKEDDDLKFILFSDYVSDYYLPSTRQTGNDFFFSKSDDFEKVFDVMSQMIKKQ